MLYLVAPAMLVLVSLGLPILPMALTAFLVEMFALGTGNGAVFQLVPRAFGREIGVMTRLVGTPGLKVTLDEMPPEAQVSNCNGVSEAAIGACVAGGARTTTAVMNATRAGRGRGSCKIVVDELVTRFNGGMAEEDPSLHYYVPCIRSRSRSWWRRYAPNPPNPFPPP